MNYPLITPKVNELVEQMNKKNIECRPLICGSIGEQPFWFENYSSDELPNAKLVHYNGIYLPNHHDLHTDEIEYICNAVNEII
jgi:dTDP-4-amino-4,6-dideoxygalactose transaminase